MATPDKPKTITKKLSMLDYINGENVGFVRDGKNCHCWTNVKAWRRRYLSQSWRVVKTCNRAQRILKDKYGVRLQKEWRCLGKNPPSIFDWRDAIIPPLV
jgi:hypothetical protein